MNRLSRKAKLKYGTANCLSTEYLSKPIFTAAGEEIVFGRAVDRLAAYEDTGLEPEEVIHIKHVLMGKVLAEIKEFEGISLDRMKELAQAEHDGLLVVLPEVPERDRKSFINGLQDYFQEASFCDPSTGIFGMSEGEKEIATTLMNALTREQAETALKKREEN